MAQSAIPRQVWLLTVAYSLMMAGTSLMVLVAGIIGSELAPYPDLATLPIALAVVGVAAATLPTGRLLQRFGRRPVFIGFGILSVLAAVGASLSLVGISFAGFCCSAFLLGCCGAAGHQYRFAALEAVPADLAAKATSILLFGGLLAAFIGPELAVRGSALLETRFAGSFLLLVLSYAAGMVLLWFYRDPDSVPGHKKTGGRPLGEILRSPIIRTAMASAALGYAIMSFIMTATPISMHQHSGHSLEATKLVIQLHIAAMYLPALVYPLLNRRFGPLGMMRWGVLAYVICLLAAFQGPELWSFGVSLVLLGVGWNFLFLAGTNLLPGGYRPEERFRVQSSNDFVVFSIQALVSLGSGWALFRLGWNGLLLVCIPMLALFTVFIAGRRGAD